MGMFNIALRAVGATLIFPINDALSSTTRTWRFTDYVTEGYKRNPVVYACLSRIKAGVAAVIINLNLDGEVVDLAEIAKLPEPVKGLARLLRRPNANQTFTELRKAWVDHIYLAGSSYFRGWGLGTDTFLGKKRSKKAPRLRLLRPDTVELEHSQDEVTKYEVHYGTRREDVKPDEIVTVRFTDPNDEFAGVSPLEPCAYTIDSSNYAIKWNMNLLKNAGVPAGVLIVKRVKQLSRKQRAELRDEFKDEVAGPDNAGNLLVMSGEDADYKQLGQTSRDLDWRGGKQESMREICAALGVPSVLLGDPQNRTYANVEAAKADFYITTILPLLRLLIDELGNFLLPKYELEERASFALNTDDVPELQENEAEWIGAYKDAFWLTIDELRERMPKPLEPFQEDWSEIPMVRLPGSLKPVQPEELVTADDEGEEIQKPADEKEEERQRRSDDELDFPGSLYPTLEQRAEFIRRQDDRREEAEPRYRRALDTYLAGQLERVLDNLDLRSEQRADVVPAEEILKPEVELLHWTDEIGPTEQSIIIEFGQAALDDLLADGTLFSIERPEMKQWLADNLAERSALINETTAADIQEILAENVGASHKETAKLLRGYYEDSIPSRRAEAIVRTEVGRADTKATLEGYSQASEKLGKRIRAEWITARDGKVRGGGKDPYSHIAMDGALTNDQDVFETGQVGEVEGPLMDGPAGWVINCRCGVAPWIEEE